jgi:hypothetical protein
VLAYWWCERDYLPALSEITSVHLIGKLAFSDCILAEHVTKRTANFMLFDIDDRPIRHSQ